MSGERPGAVVRPAARRMPLVYDGSVVPVQFR
jgi:hypothetical protein